MADPICRWRNSSVKQLIEFNSIFPLNPTEKSRGREFVENNWQLFGGSNFFTTPYQLAAQMGVYYENESILYPRFNKLISIIEACEYMQYWGKKYYAPNPYTKSIQQEKSVVINNFLVNWAIDKKGVAYFSEALKEMFSSEIGNTDILINMLNNFSEVLIKDDIVTLKDDSKTKYLDIDVWLSIDPNDKETFFRFVCEHNYSYTNLLQLNCDSAPDIANLRTALRTKPFMLLAGISGTGKSRIVKQMAFDTCPNIDNLQKDKTSPGNYQLIEVKPNWHDSTEVLGYESEIGGPHYVVTPFVKFLVKAMLYEDKVPFFVCMDEMNLAPVEQYFAEFLSVLESRKLIDGRITSEALIKAEIFQKYEDKLKHELRDHKKENKEGNEMPILTEVEEEYRNKFDILYDRLKKEGLRIPSNLIVVGTVNMDETTHQFSRKVIDRAMTIEMNIADGTEPFADFFEKDADLKYRDVPLDKDLFVSKVVQAKEALELLATENASDVDYLKANIPALLSNLNEALNGTPFKIAYRVQNELVIYFFELRRENKEATAETLLTQAMDAILMQKVLPRVEGDEDLLEKPLEKLHTFTQNYKDAHAKVEEMQARLNAHFTSFWP